MQKPRFTRTDHGDTLITRVPSIKAEGTLPGVAPARPADAPMIRMPFRVLSALIAMVCLTIPILAPADYLCGRVMMFLGAAVFGGLALLPRGRLPGAGGAGR